MDTVGWRQMIDKPASTTGKVHGFLWNTYVGLASCCCIRATAAVAAVGAGTPGELIMGCITKELIGAASTLDLIRAIT